jgi:hypothetical protein
VFVTADGRVRPHFRWLGRLLALLLTGWLAAIGAGGTGFATLPPLPGHLAVRAPVAARRGFVKLEARAGRVHVGRS